MLCLSHARPLVAIAVCAVVYILELKKVCCWYLFRSLRTGLGVLGSVDTSGTEKMGQILLMI